MNSLLFYIGNGLLKCALVRRSEKQFPEVIFWERLEVSQPEIVEIKALGEKILRSLDVLAENCRKDIFKLNISRKKIDKIFCLIAPPWYISETKTIRSQKTEPFSIKENTIDEFIRLSDMDETKDRSEKTELLERKIIQVTLNGYPTTKPVGKKTSRLEVSVVESFIDRQFFQSLKTVIEKHFSVEESHFHSLALGSFAVLRNVLNRKDDFLLINITTLLSEISMVKNGLLYETATIPIGTEKVLEIFQQKLNVSREAALSLFRLYQDNRLEDNLKTKVDQLVEDYKKNWLASLRGVLSHFSLGLSLPPSCFFLVHAPFSNFFPEILDSEEYTQFSFHDGKFKAETINEASFQNFIKFKTPTVDTSVAIMALFANISL